MFLNKLYEEMPDEGSPSTNGVKSFHSSDSNITMCICSFAGSSISVKSEMADMLI